MDMSESQPLGQPFRMLGIKLKDARKRKQESIAEVSGAVEIETGLLEQMEQGEQRPSEDILLLLINHLGMNDEEAMGIWKLAGYEDAKNIASDQLPPIAMLMPYDSRIVYADMAHVSANNYGVVMNFMQTAGPGGQATAIARIGMSKEHAESVLDLLQKTLVQADQHIKPKALPAPKAKNVSKDQK